MQQTGIKYSEYIWWSSKEKIKVRIPPELYKKNIDMSEATTKNSISKEDLVKNRKSVHQSKGKAG